MRSLDALLRVRPKPLAAGLGAAIAAICVAGVLLGYERDVAIFELLEERTLTPLFTSFLLVLAAGLALVARRTGTPLVWLGIAGFLLVMAGDEFLALHESLRQALPGGRSSYLIFIPYAALGASIWLQVLRRLRGHPSAAALWVGGAALWGASQLLDAVRMLEEGRSPDGLPLIQVVEEAFEMAGSALFLLALLVFLQRVIEPSVEPTGHGSQAARGESRPHRTQDQEMPTSAWSDPPSISRGSPEAQRGPRL